MKPCERYPVEHTDTNECEYTNTITSKQQILSKKKKKLAVVGKGLILVLPTKTLTQDIWKESKWKQYQTSLELPTFEILTELEKSSSVG